MTPTPPPQKAEADKPEFYWNDPEAALPVQLTPEQARELFTEVLPEGNE